MTVRNPSTSRGAPFPEQRLMLRAVSVLLLFLTGCGPNSGEEIPPLPETPVFAWEEGITPANWNVLVVTLDTTRRDAVGVYGAGAGVTPTLDSLATVGTVFEDMVSPVPITLPAHTTLFTGMDPPEHGVRHNGIFIVPDTLVTLAELFQERGYTTAAFVSSFPLIQRFGLDQGFAYYDDRLSDRAFSAAEESAERDARRTTTSVLDWVGAGIPSPYFVWVHLYDPHFPYAPPEPYRSRFPSNPYEGEVAFADHEVGRTLAALRAQGALDSTFVLVVGDHGESLGEHSESSHSFFAYDATQRVPCILAPPVLWRGADLTGGRIEVQTRMRDIAPTLANLLGWSPDHWRGLRSLSCLPELGRTPAAIPVTYVETLAPALDYGWHDLRGVRTSEWKYIRAPRPELYHLITDPAETVNVITEYADQVAALESWLDWYLERETKDIEIQEPDAETLERLRSLGYLGGAGGAGGAGSMEDPKDKIRYHAAINLARQLGSEYRFDEAVRYLKPVVMHEPQITVARRMVALFSLMKGDPETARPLIEGLLDEDPENPLYLGDRADLLLNEGRAADALVALEEIAARDPNAEKLEWRRGNVLESLGRNDEAIAAYHRAAEMDPRNAKPYWSAARIFIARGDTASARANLIRGLEADPEHAASFSTLADLAYARGDAGLGDSLVSRALSADIYDSRANYLQGWQRQQQGDVSGAITCYQRAVQSTPGFTLAYQNLGTLYLGTRQPALAQQNFEAALESGTETALLHLNLGTALAQQNQIAAAATQWERGLELEGDSGTRSQLTQNLAQARRMLGN